MSKQTEQILENQLVEQLKQLGYGLVHISSENQLIEKFITENLPVLEDSDEIPEAFEKFWNEEQIK